MCLQQNSDHLYHWPGFHLHYDTTEDSYFGVVKESTGEWNGALLSSVMRVGSVCMRVKDVHMYGIDLVSIIFQSAFTHQASRCGGCHQLQLTATFGVSAG